MGFLSIINGIAMVIGYIVLALVIIFLLWLLIDTIKEKRQRKKWERETGDKEKVKNILEKENKEPAQPATETQQNIEQSSQQNTETEQQTQTTEQQDTSQSSATTETPTERKEQ
ncbi:MAG: hypothetical protein QF436_00515 [Candidatus Woesearchaeota archaeon]|jgi:FtsZ-interacting cell division protein ZipA|nr:hypothetical protein [Candidatus Woesearchaeota archaeon]MDP7622581.1 hypothetical protein [Candidatus Woesearchaeota archaeon]HJN57293.1 hypothetical protein [Candidatus Woesearchaeota archaeon]|tara:strand:+ start:222 stop:563 length:342 start_codon:yes stop_codon:yes gene_type:complete